jgi:amino acid transporter
MGVGVVTQNIPQVIALVVIRRHRKHIALPFRMWAYPLPAIIALVGFFFVLFSNERSMILFAIGFMLLCSAVYVARTPLTSDPLVPDG